MPKVQIDTRDHKAGQDTQLDLDDQGLIDRPDLEVQKIDGPNAMAYADELAFMEEPVEIMVAESTDRNAENPIFVSCNGRNQFFIRGQVQTVKRKFVEILARAKQTDVQTKVIQHSAGDEPINRILKHSSLKYPFQVIRDSNPKGIEWLKRTLAEA